MKQNYQLIKEFKKIKGSNNLKKFQNGYKILTQRYLYTRYQKNMKSIYQFSVPLANSNVIHLKNNYHCRGRN